MHSRNLSVLFVRKIGQLLNPPSPLECDVIYGWSLGKHIISLPPSGPWVEATLSYPSLSCWLSKKRTIVRLMKESGCGLPSPKLPSLISATPRSSAGSVPLRWRATGKMSTSCYGLICRNQGWKIVNWLIVLQGNLVTYLTTGWWKHIKSG